MGMSTPTTKAEAREKIAKLQADSFEKSAVIFGCEATGVAELEGSRSLHIPMPGDTESLNVAQAATIVLFEYVRRIS